MAGPPIVARGWKAFINIHFTPASSIAWHTLALERLQRFIGHNDDRQTLLDLQCRAHSKSSKAAASVLTRPMNAWVMIHRFDLDATLTEKDLFDAFKEGGYTAGVDILVIISFHSC